MKSINIEKQYEVYQYKKKQNLELKTGIYQGPTVPTFSCVFENCKFARQFL